MLGKLAKHNMKISWRDAVMPQNSFGGPLQVVTDGLFSTCDIRESDVFNSKYSHAAIRTPQGNKTLKVSYMKFTISAPLKSEGRLRTQPRVVSFLFKPINRICRLWSNVHLSKTTNSQFETRDVTEKYYQMSTKVVTNSIKLQWQQKRA